MNPYTQVICGNNGDAMEVANLSSGNTHPADWFFEWASGGSKSDAGVVVNGYTALTFCPLWQGINIIAGDVGQTPCRLVRNKFTEQTNHPAWKLLRLRPNGLQTPSTFIETIMQWTLMWGNGVAWIQRLGSRPVRLVPLRPDCLWIELIEFEEREILLYHYYSPLTGRQYTFLPDEVVDIPGLTADGVSGYELFRIAKNTIGQGLALERHGNSMFANGAVPGGVLESPVGTAISRDAQARKNLRDEWNAVHRGPDKAGSIAILWEGIQYKSMAHTNVDAQWIEAKKMSRLEAASLLNLPPHKLGAMEDSSVRSNLEEQNADYAQRTLTRWYNRMGEEFKRKLLTEREWMSGEYEFIWDVSAFLKADVDTMTTVLDRLVKAAIINPNEARAELGRAPYDGGDVYGSPAINPNPRQPQASSEGDESDESEDTNQKSDLETANIDLLRDRLAQFLKMESLMLKQAAGGKVSGDGVDARNFVEWLDAFYLGNGKPSRVSSVFDSIVGKSLKVACMSGVKASHLPETVQLWALSRRAGLLEACSTVTAKDLPAAVESLSVPALDSAAETILVAALKQSETSED